MKEPLLKSRECLIPRNILEATIIIMALRSYHNVTKTSSNKKMNLAIGIRDNTILPENVFYFSNYDGCDSYIHKYYRVPTIGMHQINFAEFVQRYKDQIE